MPQQNIEHIQMREIENPIIILIMMMMEQLSMKMGQFEITKLKPYDILYQQQQNEAIIVNYILCTYAKELTQILQTTYLDSKGESLGVNFQVGNKNNHKGYSEWQENKNRNQILLKNKKILSQISVTNPQNLINHGLIRPSAKDYHFEIKFKEIFSKLCHKIQIVNPLKLVINQNIEADNPEVFFYVLRDQMRRNGEVFQTLKSLFTSNKSNLQTYCITLQETSDLVFDTIAFDKQLKEEFIKTITKCLSLDLKIEENEIKIIGVEKGSIKVIFEVKDASGKVHESQNLYELQRQFPNSQPQLKLHEYFKEAQLSVSDFAQQYNKNWDNISFGTVRYRGPYGRTQNYFCPVGWSGYGLNVQGKYGYNNNWLGNNNNNEEYYSLFHGSHFNGLKGIKNIQMGLKPGPAQVYQNNICLITKQTIGVGVYFSNHIEVCESYANSHRNSNTSIGDMKFLLAIQSRIKPDALRQCPKSSDLGSLRNEYKKNHPNYDKSLDDMKLWDNDYFVVNNSCDIRPQRLLLKRIK